MATVHPIRTPSRATAPGTALPALRLAAGDEPRVVRAVQVVSLLGPVGSLVAVVATHGRSGVGVWVAASGILLGVPHGSADHLVPFWASGSRANRRTVLALVAGYLLTLALALSAALVAPRWALAIFLVVSALHFGRGESVFAAQRAARATPAWHDDVLVTVAHGLVTVGLPLALWPATSLPLLDQVAPGFSTWARAWPRPLLAATVALAAAALLQLVRRRRWAQAADLTCLALLFVLADPLIAFGVYFALWHSARHILRLVHLPGLLAGPGTRVQDLGDLRAGLVRYLRAAALPTAVAVGILAAMWSGRQSSLLPAELSTLIALTAPHVLVVGWVDALFVER